MAGRVLSLAFLLAGPVVAAQDAAAPRAQAPAPPTFPGQVEQVTVDVVVADRKGVPVRGLAKPDFEVLEDGVPQEVVSFEAVDVPPAPAAAAPRPLPTISTNQQKEDAQGRTFVILFDDIRLTPAMAQRAKAAVASFLERGVREGDRVTLVATLAGTWWTARMESGREEILALLKRLDGRYIPDNSRERMTDLEARRIYVDRDIETAQRVQRRYEELGVAQQQQATNPQQSRYFATRVSPYVESRAAEVYAQSKSRTRTTLEVLERSLEALNATRGRKSLILVSAGFVWDPNLEQFRWVAQASRRANAAIYFVNAEGLSTLSFQTAEFGAPVPEVDLGFALTEDFWDAEGAESIASESGGFTVHDTNDLAAGLLRIADENGSYYLLGYNPTHAARDGAFRKITVRVPGHKGVEVRARKGYYAPNDDPRAARSRPGTDRALQEALDSPFELGTIPLRMTHFVGEEATLGKAQVDLVAEVDVRGLELEAKEGRYLGGLDVLLVAAHRDTGEVFRYDQKVGLKLLPATRDKLRKTWFPIRRGFELAPGAYQARMVVRDARSGRVATVTHRFEVPSLGEFRVSTPVLTDSREGGEGGQEQPLPVARRAFERGEEITCRFEVYGAEKDRSGVPQVAMGYALRRTDGDVVKQVQPTDIVPTSLGKLSRLFHIGPEAAQPGSYELVMAFLDHVSGRTLVVKEPFTVVAEGALAQASAQPGN